jgi:hypothetical protein
MLIINLVPSPRVYRVVSECLLVLLQSELVKPDCDIHAVARH